MHTFLSYINSAIRGLFRVSRRLSNGSQCKHVNMEIGFENSAVMITG
jgi:hypothetical protein